MILLAAPHPLRTPHFFCNKAENPSANLFPLRVVLVVQRSLVVVVGRVVHVMERLVERSVEAVEDAVGKDVQLGHLEILLLLSGSCIVRN